MLVTRLDPTGLFSLRKRMLLRIRFLSKRYGKDLSEFLSSDSFIQNASAIETDLAIIKKFTEEKLSKLLLEVFDGKSFESWWRKVIRVAYSRGVVAGFKDLKLVSPVNPILPFAQLVVEIGKIATVRDLAEESLGVLVQSVSDKLSLTTSRSVTLLTGEAGGLLRSGATPRQIASELVAQAVKSLDVDLVRTMQTETTRAFAWGQLDAAGILGVSNVSVFAEIHGINDSRRCAICRDLDGSVHTLDQARTLIPLHPACRCRYSLISSEAVNSKVKLRLSSLREALGLKKGE